MTGDEFIFLLNRLNAERQRSGNESDAVVFRLYGWTTDELAEKITREVQKNTFDKEMAKEAVLAVLTGVIIQVGDSINLDALAGLIAGNIEAEMTLAARISAGYHPSRNCRMCNGPLEESIDDPSVCMKCQLTARIEHLEEKLHRMESVNSRLRRTIDDLQEILNEANNGQANR